MKKSSPKKKAKPKPQPVVAAPAPVPQDEMDSGRRSEIRVLALQTFISSTGKLSIPRMRMEAPFSDIPEGTLRKWSLADSWQDRRAEFQQAVLKSFIEKASGEVAQMYQTMLARLNPIDDKMFAALSSMEFKELPALKLVETYVKLLEAKSKFMEQAAKILTPPVPGVTDGVLDETGVGGDEGEAEFTVEEARVVAQAILRHRAALRAPVSSAGDPAGPQQEADVSGGVHDGDSGGGHG